MESGPSGESGETLERIEEATWHQVRDSIPEMDVEAPRLANWPDEEARLLLQTEWPGHLSFETGAVELGSMPEEVDALRFGDDWIVVRVGPVGEWYRHDTLYLLLDAKTHELRAAGVYLYTDLVTLSGWGTVRGKLRVDPASGPESGRLRASYELYPEEAHGSATPWFKGSFEISTREDSAGLQGDLESFGATFAD